MRVRPRDRSDVEETIHGSTDCRVPDAPPRQPRQAARAGPHLVGADAFGHGVGRDNSVRPARRFVPDVPGEVIDRVVFLQRRELPRVDAQHRAAAPERLLDDDVVLAGEPGIEAASPSTITSIAGESAAR
jgi:hypothetical protein